MIEGFEMFDLFTAYERGFDDGFNQGWESDAYDEGSDNERYAYRRGYDRGVALFCEGLDENEDGESLDLTDSVECVCGRGNCPTCGKGFPKEWSK